jgi:hypothetical protein
MAYKYVNHKTLMFFKRIFYIEGFIYLWFSSIRDRRIFKGNKLNITQQYNYVRLFILF